MAGTMVPSGGSSPVQVDVAVPERVERWRPLVLWVLVIPNIVVLYIYGIGLFFVLIAGWFAALFTGHLPDSLERFATGYLRYQWRVTAYLYGLSTVYPSFGLPSGDADPGDDAAVALFRRDERLSRVKVFFRYFMILPHVIVLYVIGIAASVVSIIAFFAVLFTGRWPTGMRDFFVGYHRWYLRVYAFYFMITDAYPPFSLT